MVKLGKRFSWPASVFSHADVRHVLAVGLHNLEIMVVYPDAALEVALVLVDPFGRDVKHIGAQFIFFLFADVEDVVLGDLVLGQHERHPVLDVVDVFPRHHDRCSDDCGVKHYLFDATSLVVEGTSQLACNHRPRCRCRASSP